MFRLSCYLLSLILMIVGVSGCQSGPEKQTEWGVYQEPVKPQKLPESKGEKQISVMWKRDIGSGAELGFAMIRPAFSDNELFVAERNGRVVKINPESGEILWDIDLDSAIFSGVGANEGIASVGLDNGDLVALDTDDGFVLWRVPVRRQFSSLPAVGKSRVVIRTADGFIIGLNAESGQTEWTLQRNIPGLSLHGDSTPVIAGDAVLSGYASGKLIANNVVNGRVYWESAFSLPKGNNEIDRLIDSDTPPIVSGNTAYAASYQGGVSSIKLQNATLNWKTDISTRLPMYLEESTLFVTDELGKIFALDALTGEIKWEQTAFMGHGISMPVSLFNKVVIGDANGNIHLLDQHTGDYLESKSIVNGAVTHLVSGNYQIAVFSSTGDIAAISL